MKILSISDVVVSLVQSPAIAQRFSDIDLVLGCGDLPFDYMEYIVTMLGRPLFHVYGNHAQHKRLSANGTLRSAHPEGCINIHRRVINYRGLIIGGLEGSMRYREGPHQYTQREMALQALSMAPQLWLNRLRYGRAIDILITHAPPFGIHDGADLCHQGFLALLSFMDRYKPRYLIHGHTHLYRQDARRVTRYNETLVVNTYGYQIIEIDETTLGRAGGS
ncbi:MAG TPA: metallophosphoesterase [Chloroflexi bacterium]|jgi:Icc-related predicted phosphoesterase|nr:metallophosphoesterase [Chloroflexota bacterium]